MGEVIKLDSKSHRAAVRAIAKDSILTCSNTSAPDVFVNGIISNKEGHSLFAGDSMAVPKVSTLSLRIFRSHASDELFSAELDLSPISDGTSSSTGA
jgi:hypothetical protein